MLGMSGWESVPAPQAGGDRVGRVADRVPKPGVGYRRLPSCGPVAFLRHPVAFLRHPSHFCVTMRQAASVIGVRPLVPVFPQAGASARAIFR